MKPLLLSQEPPLPCEQPPILGSLLCLTLPLAAVDQRFSKRVKLAGGMTVSVYISQYDHDPANAQVVFLRPGDAPPLKATETSLKLQDKDGMEIPCQLSNQGDDLPAGHGYEGTTDALAYYHLKTDDVKKIASATVTQGAEHTRALPLFDEDPNPHLDGSRDTSNTTLGGRECSVSVRPFKDGGVIAEISISALSIEHLASSDFSLTLIDSKGRELKPQPFDQRESPIMVSTMPVRLSDGTETSACTANLEYKLDGIAPADLVESRPSYRGEVVKLKFKTPPLPATKGQ